MSYYTERGVFFKIEGTWGTEATPTSTDVINYLMDYEAEISDQKEEAFVIGGGRDSRKRAWLQREVVGALEFEPLTGRMFYFALGDAAGENSSSGATSSLPCTITPGTVVPGITIWREARDPEEWICTYGNKIDRFEFTIEQSGGVMMAVDLVGKNGNNTDHTWMTPDIAFSLDPLSFYHSEVVYTGPYGNTTLDHLRSFVVEGRNNLEARFSAGAGTFIASEIREQGFEVGGRLVIDYPFSTFATDILARDEGTIVATVGNSQNGTMVITLCNVTFESYPDAISGLDIMELDLAFTARKPTGGYAMTVTVDHPSITTLDGLDF